MAIYTCTPYTTNAEICYYLFSLSSTHTLTSTVEVIIPRDTVILEEGSATDPAIFQLNLTNDSYTELNVLINVDEAYRSRVSPNTNIMFNQGQRQAVSEPKITIDTKHLH